MFIYQEAAATENNPKKFKYFGRKKEKSKEKNPLKSIKLKLKIQLSFCMQRKTFCQLLRASKESQAEKEKFNKRYAKNSSRIIGLFLTIPFNF